MIFRKRVLPVALVSFVAGCGSHVAGRQPVPRDTSPVPAPPGIPKRFDPLVRYAALGWVPGGLPTRNIDADSGSFVLSAQTARPDGGGGPEVQVTLLPEGKKVSGNGTIPAQADTRCPWGSHVAAAPAIGGRSAQWVLSRDVPGAGCRLTAFQLRWQYAPNAWAVAELNEVPGDKATLSKVAETLRVGPNRRALLPFRATALPEPGEQVTESTEQWNGNDWSTSITLAHGSESCEQGCGATIEAGNRNDCTKPDTTVAGHRVCTFDYTNESGYHEELRAPGIHGLQFHITAYTSGAAGQILGGLKVTWTVSPLAPR